MTRPYKAMGRTCFAHKHREDVPLEVHHIWPKSDSGPDIAANKVTLCSNGHGSVHDLLAKMLKAGTPDIPWKVRRRYGHRVRRIALAGYTAIKTRVVTAP